MGRLRLYLKLIRVKQWIKNFFLFAPIVFSGKWMDAELLKAAGLAFFSFSFISSGVYIINDLIDAPRDQNHPKKRARPIASGQISKAAAKMVAAGFFFSGLQLAFWLGEAFSYYIALYLALHGLYNFAGKRIVLIDVGCIALGFCLRIWAGAAAVGVMPSGWLQMCVFLLALFLGFAKRRAEIVVLKERSEEHRVVLRHYSLYFLDHLLMISATLAIVFYGMYTISPDIVARGHGRAMVYSLVFVVYGIFRYLYLIHVKRTKEDTDEILLTDLPMILNLLAWAMFVFFVIYS